MPVRAFRGVCPRILARARIQMMDDTFSSVFAHQRRASTQSSSAMRVTSPVVPPYEPPRLASRGTSTDKSRSQRLSSPASPDAQHSQISTVMTAWRAMVCRQTTGTLQWLSSATERWNARRACGHADLTPAPAATVVRRTRATSFLSWSASGTTLTWLNRGVVVGSRTDS